jgi:spore maturation protein CgeB
MRVLAPLLRYDYGKKERGESLEKVCFVPAMASAGADVHPLWLEEHGYPSDIDGLQRAVESEAERISPDLVFFILMEDEIRLETLDRLNRRYLTCNWFADDQWRFESFTRYVAPRLTFSITVDKYSLPLYWAIGCRNVVLSQWGCLESSQNRNSPPESRYDVSFIGSRNLARGWYVDALARAGIIVECFGAGWPRGRVSFQQSKEICGGSKICLNLSNSEPRDLAFREFLWNKAGRAFIGRSDAGDGYVQNLRHALGPILRRKRNEKRAEQIKMRNFEIPAWGGFQVSQFALQIDDYFVPGKEIALFSNVQELVTVVKYYLANDAERETIRAAGCARAASHSLASRMRSIFEKAENEKSLVRC